jgi:heat shock protein HslJ
MNGRVLTIAVILGAVLLAACSPSAPGGASLEGTQWVLVLVDGAPPLSGTTPSADFTADQISGSTGCNSYFGSYEVSGSDITFGPLGMTEMYCMDPEGIMDQEVAILEALASVASYRLSGTRLEMLDGAGSVILAFEPPPAVPEMPLEGTEWVLTSFIEGEAVASTLSGTEITLQFEAGEVGGSAGCNGYSGPYILEGSELSFTMLAMTVQACLEPNGVMDQETHFMDILENVTSFELEANQLTLNTSDGRGLMFLPR